MSADEQRIKTDIFTARTWGVPELKEFREYIEQNAYGFGERAFYWHWWLLIEQMPAKFSFLEIGVFRGQTLALIALIAEMQGKEAKIYGLTPLDSTDGHWESDYEADVKNLHDEFDLPQPKIIKGLSTDKNTIAIAALHAPYDIVYIDGGHTKEVIESDLLNFPQLATKYLVVDDCCNDIPMPWGYFTGIQAVTDAVNNWYNNQKEFIFKDNIVHIKTFERNAPDTNI